MTVKPDGSNPSDSVDLKNQIDKDADEFGSHYRQGGWRLGLLVARSVLPRQGKRTDLATGGEVAKVSAAEFARRADIGESTVKYYYKAWKMAAEDDTAPAVVLHPDKLNPGDDDPSIEDLADTSEDRRKLWQKYYRRAKDSASNAKARLDELKQWAATGSDEVKKLATESLAIIEINEDELDSCYQSVKKVVVKEANAIKAAAKKAAAEEAAKNPDPEPLKNNKTPETNQVKLLNNLVKIRRTLLNSVELAQDSDPQSVLGYIAEVRDVLDAIEQRLTSGSLDDAFAKLLAEMKAKEEKEN